MIPDVIGEDRKRDGNEQKRAEFKADEQHRAEPADVLAFNWAVI